MSVGLGLGFAFVRLLRFGTLCVFLVSLAYFVLVLFAFVAEFLQYYTKRLARKKGRRTSPKWPILRRVGHKTLTQSISWLGSGVGELVQREWPLSWWIIDAWISMVEVGTLSCIQCFETVDSTTGRASDLWTTCSNLPQSFSFRRRGLTLTDCREEGSSSSSSCVLSAAGRCCSYERAPGLTILRLMIGGWQTNVEWC